MKKLLLVLSVTLILLLCGAGALLWFSPKPPLLKGIPYSQAVYAQHHHLLRLTLSKDDKYRVLTPFSRIPNFLIQATLLQEDQYFYSHFGVNPLALIKAGWKTYAKHSRRIGASTITMQLARIRFGIHSKTLKGKLGQILRALQIERHYSKKEILEAYLNLAPYGGNIEGIGAASLIYFNKESDALNLPEALTLSIIPQNPGKRIPNYPHLKTIRNRLFAQWLKKYPEDLNKKMLFDLPLAMKSSHNLPFYAPHLVYKVLQEPLEPTHTRNTTLDLSLQRVVEKITKQYVLRKKNKGVHNAVVLLVDTRDMGAKAFMGSVDFFNTAIAGQNNGVEAKRSPGSTLKPFIYGLALDQGLIHPNTVLKDVPRSFNGYNPENFDYDFIGPVKAKEALVLSRNIPAVDLANQLTNPNLYQLLERAQVSALHAESYYGLSLHLGGVELSMRELVSLYAMLINEGLWYPINIIQNQTKKEGVKLLSPEASFLVLDMLRHTPGQNSVFKSLKSLPVSWKTGTSSGYRDAWTVGSFGPYVLGVWIGNFDNTSNPAFIGKDIAAPLFFELIDAIQQEKGPLPQMTSKRNLNLKKIKVCKASGMLPTPYCLDQELTWFIPGFSPITTDTIFREVAINSKTGLRTCHFNKETRFQVFEFWPSDVLKIFKSAGIQRNTPPLWESDCTLTTNKGISPQITSPQAGIKYVLRVNSTHNTKIPLTAVTDAGVSNIYWFINETFIAKIPADHPLLWKAKPGKFVVRVVDDRGMASARDMVVLMDK